MAASESSSQHDVENSLLDLMENMRRIRCLSKRIELLRSATHAVKNMKGDLLRSCMRSTHLSPLFRLVSDFAIQPEFSCREHFVYEKEDFTGFVERAETALGFLCAYFDVCINCSATESTCIDDCLPKLLVVISANIRSNLWSTESVQKLSLLVLNQLRILYKVDSLSDLLLLDAKSTMKDVSTPSKCVLGRYLMEVKQILTKDKWQKNPTIVESFYWMLTNMIKFPHLSDYLDIVFPPSLMFIDSHVTEHRIMGIHCLHHIARNVTGEELRWYGRADVMFAALKQQVYTREPEIMRALFLALLTVLPIVDKDPAKPIAGLSKPRQVDAILAIMVTNALTENGIVLRRMYTQCIADLLDILGVGAVRHLRRLLELVSSYLEVFDGPEEQARFNTLRILKSLEKNCWPRISSHADEILQSLLKLIQDVASDRSTTPEPVKERLKAEAVECLNLLKELCPEVGDCLHTVCQTPELSYISSSLKDLI
ncbi:hypothetical protein BaRGS_00011849 [Batillaria attramentaria]|uniref:TELO2-interacting protein 2 n=1 Tax=Batillaria attramentaria TaxID=370345 RepID=A0ABD0LD21_9CAEN